MVAQIDLEHCTIAEIKRHPVAWREEAEAGRVDKRHDSHWHAAIRKVNTADTSVVLEFNAQEVLVLAMFAVACGLDSSHHELILWRNFLLDALLLSPFSHFIFNLI